MRRPRGPGGRFLTAEEVQAMEKEKRAQENSETQAIASSNGNGVTHHQHQQGSIQKGKEPQQASKLDHNRTPNRMPVPVASVGISINVSGGSGKRKASAMTASNQSHAGSPLKRPKSGNGMLMRRSLAEDEEVSEEDLEELNDD